MKIARSLLPALLTALLGVVAVAQVQFQPTDFAVGDFRDADKIQGTCAVPASASFFCNRFETALTRIPTKGVDFFFDRAGHLVAAFAKQQKGQRLRNYSVDARQNLIPFESASPGGALMVAGEFLDPVEVEGNWDPDPLDQNIYLGQFRYRVGDFEVDKLVRVSNVSHTFELELTVTRVPAEATVGAEGLAISLVFPGVAGQATPTIKVGQGASFSLNPLSQPVADPTYISLQSNNQNRGFAIVIRPGGSSLDGLNALALPPRSVAIQRILAPNEAETMFDLEIYTGANELVRYYQEGYYQVGRDQFPGLFRPNILGRLSISIIQVLEFIYKYVHSWGLSIIVLTLLFRVLVWPLISVQTRSMFGMQKLQPQIQALQKKHKDDREKLSQETMKLYREAGVNPAGGCLPILLQMPLFIILWRVFVNFEFDEGFLWLPDLGQPDRLLILPILYVGVMLAQSFFSAKGNPSSLRQQIIINLVFAFIIFQFPAGVILYFVVSMLVQVLQYWLISRNQPALAPAKAK
ncbi:MAG: membrane protein insertase YidC [Truepera sp.]|nr:membrane protein insertase YidC [Truepera sp.]